VTALADGIERALRAAERPRPVMSPAVPVCAREVLAAYDDLVALAALLRTAPAPPVRALALARRLMLDGAGPLFNPETADTLGGAVREVLLAFDSNHATYPPEA
jgi:hypothetical protein